MSTDMALDELESKEIKDLEEITITVEGPTSQLLQELTQLAANKNENQEEDHYIKYVLNQRQSLIGMNLKDPISLWYHDYNLRPAPPKLKESMINFLIEHGSSKDQFHDTYLQNSKFKLSASITGESFPLPPNPEVYAYEVISRAIKVKESYQSASQVSKLGMFSRAPKSETGQSFENDQPTPPSKGMKG